MILVRNPRDFFGRYRVLYCCSSPKSCLVALSDPQFQTTLWGIALYNTVAAR